MLLLLRFQQNLCRLPVKAWEVFSVSCKRQNTTGSRRCCQITCRLLFWWHLQESQLIDEVYFFFLHINSSSLFSFQLLPLGVTTAGHLPTISCLLHCYINHLHVFHNYTQMVFLFSSSLETASPASIVCQHPPPPPPPPHLSNFMSKWLHLNW